MSIVKPLGEKILKKTGFGVDVQGVDVIMKIGNATVTMSYEVAFKLSAFLRHGGTLAKRAAGDQSRRFTVVADLTDANAEEMKAAMSKDRKSVFFRG
jgi:hypothetical protein